MVEEGVVLAMYPHGRGGALRPLGLGGTPGVPREGGGNGNGHSNNRVSERSERALMKKSILAMDLAKWLQTAASTTKLTHPILLARLVRFACASLKMRTISLRSAQDCAQQDGAGEQHVCEPH